MTLDELFELYTRKKLRGASDDTIRLYKHSIASFQKSVGKLCTVDDLTDDNLDDHMWKLVKAGRSPATANKDRAQITAIWRFANRNQIVKSWPNVQPLKEPERIPLGWMPHEIDLLMASAEKETGSIAGIKASVWWKGLLNLILDTGERIGAIRRVEKQHIYGDHILIPSMNRKGKTRDKLYAPSPDTMQCIIELASMSDTSALFPWDMQKTHIYYRYNRILSRAKLPTDARSKFHRIRRTVASAVANQGGNPTTALDHSNARVTRRYLDPRIVEETPTSKHVRNWLKNKKKNNDQKDAG